MGYNQCQLKFLLDYKGTKFLLHQIMILVLTHNWNTLISMVDHLFLWKGTHVCISRHEYKQNDFTQKSNYSYYLQFRSVCISISQINELFSGFLIYCLRYHGLSLLAELCSVRRHGTMGILLTGVICLLLRLPTSLEVVVMFLEVQIHIRFE